MLELNINGRSVEIGDDVDPTMPLLWVLRDTLGLVGTKYGCGVGQCSACTVHVNGAATRSCSVPAALVQGQAITTIEGLAPVNQPHALQAAWIKHQVPQCGYCQSGMIMAAAALLAKSPKPTDDEINSEVTNICRCGTYERVRKAIHAAASVAEAGAHE